MKSTLRLLVCGLAGFVPACAVIWGFEDGTLADLSPTDDGATSGGQPSSSSGAPTTDDADPPDDTSVPVPDGCEERVVDAEHGLFVDQLTGDDQGECLIDAPCRTVGYALTQLEGSAKNVIYIGSGNYPESLELSTPLLGRNLRLEGRWQLSNDGWQPYCDNDPQMLARLTGSSTVDESDIITLKVLGVAATAPDDEDEPNDAGADADADASAPPVDLILSSLALQSRDVPDVPNNRPGRSSYVVFAKHAKIVIKDSNLVAGVAAHGGQSAAKAEAASGRTGPCQSGTAGNNGSPSTTRVTEDGWHQTADIAPTAGQNGSCTFAGICTEGPRGGPAGTNGQRGGSSTALYAWSSELLLEGAFSLESKPGGNGSPGQEGGDASGASCPASSRTAGGKGGDGARGPGGSSFCVVLGGESQLEGTLNGQNCRYGQAGAGGVGGEEGMVWRPTPNDEQ